MLYLSQLQSAPVEDSHGVRIGKISDLLTFRDDSSLCCVFLIEGQDDQFWYAPADGVVWRDHTLHLPLDIAQLDLAVDPLSPRQVALAGEVLDKQVIDLARERPVRVHDICISDDWRVLGVDNSPLGLVRRLAPPWLLGARSKNTPVSLIPWERIALIDTPQEKNHEEVQPVAAPAQEATTIPQSAHLTGGQLTELHPADIADILEAMGPDEAADLLAKLSEERAQELLRLMTPEESEDVQELLAYEENSAGSLMTTDYIALNATRTVSEALEAVRANIQDDIRATYVYCVPDETQDVNALLGVVSLWDLLAAYPNRQLHELMETDVVAVRADTAPRTVAEVMARYNLLAVPVVTATGILEGVVTVDNALEALLPNTRRKPRQMY